MFGLYKYRYIYITILYYYIWGELRHGEDEAVGGGEEVPGAGHLVRHGEKEGEHHTEQGDGLQRRHGALSVQPAAYPEAKLLVGFEGLASTLRIGLAVGRPWS